MQKDLSKKNNYLAITIIGVLFFIFGFVSWLNSLLIPYFKLACGLNNRQSMLVAFAFYFSYFIMAIPSAAILKRTGFKNGMTLGLWVMAVGALIFVPAALSRTYSVFLCGLFVQATGLTILQTASNPYITILGPIESAASRISIMGVCNKTAGAIAPLILLSAVTRHPDEIDQLKASLPAMTMAKQAEVLNELASRLIIPYILMAVVLTGLGLLIRYSSLPDVKEEADIPAAPGLDHVAGGRTKAGKTSIFQFPHLLLGTLAIFFGVSAEVLAVDSIIGYSEYMGYSFKEAKYFATYTLLIMIISYLTGIWAIPRYIRQRRVLQCSAMLGLIVSLLAISIKGSLSVWFIALLGLSNALLWPSTWPLALEGLGKFTKQGSALLIMGVAGGAVTPLLYGVLSDLYNPQLAYWVLVPCYAFILFFAVKAKPLKYIGLVAACLVLYGGTSSFAQEIPRATGNWDRQQLGNHRAVITVHNDTDAVWVHVPWRREDDPGKKAICIVDASTGKKIKNVHLLTANREYGDVVFEPVTGKGTYYLYYMPYKTLGSWYFPNTVYLPPTEGFDPQWWQRSGLAVSGGPGALAQAEVVRFESINTFNSFDPMEIIATKAETGALLKQNEAKGFLIFPEDRKYPIRMSADIPLRWAGRKDNEPFSGTAMRNEFYVYQLGIYAAFGDLEHLHLVFSDLTDANGRKIPSSAIRCFNLGGRDWLGKPFTKDVHIRKGQVQSLWIGIDIPENASPGQYSGTVTVQADGDQSRQTMVHINIQDRVIADRGYDELFRMARLNWLDSDIGLDDSVFRPYTPVELNGQMVTVLGRALRFDNHGLPEKITSSFKGSNDSANGPAINILAAPIQLVTIRNGKPVSWKGSRPTIIKKTSGAVAWKTRQTSQGAEMEITAKMESDGYINYEVTFTARQAMSIDDIQLLIPYAKPIATYMMGLGFKGGRRPQKWDWIWDKGKANNMVWVGDVNAGVQCKLKNETPDWSLYNFDKTGPYKDWSNEGLGGCTLSEEANSFLFKAFTGRKTLHAGQVLHLNFGLLITPVKLLDNNHWNERYFHSDPPVDNWLPRAIAKGANIMNIHQGNILNPYINYPFIAADTMKNYIAAARAKGIRSKIYYTVRELSNYTAELWALRSLGDEIFTPGLGAQLADQFADDGAGGNLYSTGGSWLTEHLRTNYDAAWHSPLQGGDWDMAIRTQGLSRWHNYYLEGLRWLVKNEGIRGIYLDGVGYDREIMKRVRKVLDRAADSCLIDFHSGNNFQPAYGLNSTANEYMELFPCINSLWLGEMFNYNEGPDYWLTEMAGIPFGLYGEMLNGCGNAWRGMLYGMTSRLGWGDCDPSALWKVWDAFGIQAAKMIGYWDPALPVKCNNNDVKVTVYRRPDRVLIAYASWAKQDVHIKLVPDWKKLQMDAAQVSMTAPAIPGFQEQHDYPTLEDITVPAGKGGIIILEKK